MKLLRRGSSKWRDFLIYAASFVVFWGANHFHDSFPLAKNDLHFSTSMCMYIRIYKSVMRISIEERCYGYIDMSSQIIILGFIGVMARFVSSYIQYSCAVYLYSIKTRGGWIWL